MRGSIMRKLDNYGVIFCQSDNHFTVIEVLLLGLFLTVFVNLYTHIYIYIILRAIQKLILIFIDLLSYFGASGNTLA